MGAIRHNSTLLKYTPRNLEYILDEVGQKANIRSVQRCGAALNLRHPRLANGIPEERLRLKLGSRQESPGARQIHQLAGH